MTTGGGAASAGPSTGAGQVIAIDGPAGSGKSTVARAVADRLSLARLDTGAMYRAVTLLALRSGVELGDEEAVTALARDMSLRLGEARLGGSDESRRSGGAAGSERAEEVMLEGRDVSEPIRSREVDAAVSVVAALPGVRRELVRRQREWVAAHGGGVVEGRDIGSVVFPEARLKVYLTASPDERARRRIEQSGTSAMLGDVLHRRDRLDSTRADSPLVVADGAIVVDSTGRTVDEVVEEVLSHL